MNTTDNLLHKVIFDGECGICRLLIVFVENQCQAGRLEFIPFQTESLASLAPGITVAKARKALHIIKVDGHQIRGARAVFEVMKYLPGPWHILGWILSLSVISHLAEPFYYLFAHNRDLISGLLGLQKCAISFNHIANRTNKKAEAHVQNK